MERNHKDCLVICESDAHSPRGTVRTAHKITAQCKRPRHATPHAQQNRDEK